MYITEINGGLKTVITEADVKAAKAVCQRAVDGAFQRFTDDERWWDRLPPAIRIAIHNDFDRRYWAQLAPEWMPEPDDIDKTSMTAEIHWRIVGKTVEGRKLEKISFFFADHPAFEIHAATIR